MPNSNKNNGKRIGFAGCRVTTHDAIVNLIKQGYKIDYLITISPDDAANKYHISGYEDLQDLARNNAITVHHVEDYRLREGERDREVITAMKLDLLIALGWQRIIPKWFLGILSIGSIGMHGGPELPPFGRGHSVMNWSLIEGRTKFLSYLFFYLPKVDAGPIIGTYEYDINTWDTCETLHFKYQLSMGRLLVENLPKILSGDFETIPQKSHGATYYPRRTPDDGVIDWNQQVHAIHNLVRGVTHPYPGAFTELEGKRITIWRGQPFDTKITWNVKPGTIVEVFYNGNFVVQTRNFGLLVDDYDGIRLTSADIGKVLG